MATSFQKIRAEPDLRSRMNVTPMIDVLLVLLVTFMLSHAMRQMIPFGGPVETAAPVELNPQVTLQLHADGTAAVNGQPVPRERLAPYLAGIFQSRNVKLLFIQPSMDLPYADVVSAVSIARGAGARTVALRRSMKAVD